MTAKPRPIELWKDGGVKFKDDEFKPFIKFYPADTRKPAGAVLICPGGGYAGRAPYEGDDVAVALNRRGFSAVVLEYRVKPSVYPAPQNDVSRAMRLARYHAKKWNIRPDKIAVCGFSAGGHLAACLGTMFSKSTALFSESIDDIADRPDALILCYPVLSSGKFGHKGSFQNLLGTRPGPGLMSKLSLEKRVTKDTPPTFIFFTDADPVVPVENGLLFAQALRKNGVRFEMHVWPGARHGVGLAAPETPRVDAWLGECCAWLGSMGWED
jgi:acetyl esterase/lipase